MEQCRRNVGENIGENVAEITARAPNFLLVDMDLCFLCGGMSINGAKTLELSGK